MTNQPPALNRLLWLSPVLLCIVFFSTCSRAKNNDKLFQALQEGIDNSTQSITWNNSVIYASLERKSNEYATRERAAVWLPRATHIRQLSKEMASYIDSLKPGVQQAHRIEKKKALELYQKMKKYRTDLLQTDSSLAYTFSTSMTITIQAFDSLYSEPNEFFSYFFDHSSTAASLALLSRFENNIRLAENRMLAFCNEQVINISFIYDFISAIVNQSRQFVKPGEKIELKAGIGSFTTRNNPEIMINRKKAQLNEYGLAIYTFQAPLKPGEYTMPVNISYTNQDGKQESLATHIKYTVEEPCSNQ